MKWVAYALALLALIIGGLSLTVPPREQAADDAGHRLPRVARLQLASELPAPKTEPKSSSAKPSFSGITPPKLPSPSIQASSPAVTSSSAVTSAGGGIPGAVSSAGGNTLETSAQTTETSASGAAQSELDTRPPDSAPSPKPASQCLVVTGLGAKPQAERLIKTMAAAGAQGRLRSRQQSLAPLNWVLTDRYSSRRQALKALRHFQRRGIDSFLVTQGQWANAISLGLYQSSRLAREAQHRLGKKGIRVHIEPYTRSREEFFVRFRALSGKQAAVLRKTVKPGQEDAEKERIIACEGVASPDKSP